MNSSVGKGTIVLVVGGLLCKLLGGLFRLPLTNIVGTQGIGVFQMIMSIFSFAIVFTSSGITNCLSKLVSSARARGDLKAVGAYIKHALIFVFCTSGFFSLICLVFPSQFVALQGIPYGKGSYMLLALIIPLGGFIGVARGVLQGYGDMNPTAASQVIEQIAKLVFGLAFAYFLAKKDVRLGVFGAFLGIAVSEALSLLYLGFILIKRKSLSFGRGYRKEFYSASMPLTLSGVVVPFTHAIESFIIVNLLVNVGYAKDVATTLFGLQSGVVGAILNFPLIISLSLAMSLLPNLSFLATKNDRQSQADLITKSFSSMWFLLLPLVLGIIALSSKVYPIIYPSIMGENLKMAVLLTRVGGGSVVILAITQFLTCVLQANGMFKNNLLFNCTGGGVKILTLIIFAQIKGLGILAVPLSNIAMSLVISVLSLIKLEGLVRVKLIDIFLPLFSSFAMYFIVNIFLSFNSSLFFIILSVALGGVSYLALCLPLTKKYYSLLMGKVKKIDNNLQKK